MHDTLNDCDVASTGGLVVRSYSPSVKGEAIYTVLLAEIMSLEQTRCAFCTDILVISPFIREPRALYSLILMCATAAAKLWSFRDLNCFIETNEGNLEPLGLKAVFEDMLPKIQRLEF